MDSNSIKAVVGLAIIAGVGWLIMHETDEPAPRRPKKVREETPPAPAPEEEEHQVPAAAAPAPGHAVEPAPAS